MPYERIDPIDRTQPSAVDPVRPALLTPVEREAERRRREERRRRREQPGDGTAQRRPPAGERPEDGEQPRLDVRG